MQAADLKVVGAATTGAVTLANSQTISGVEADVTAALITAPSKVSVRAGVANTATVTDATTAAKAAAIAGVVDVTAGFTNGLSDSVVNLVNGDSTAVSAELAAVVGDDADVAIALNDAAGAQTAVDIEIASAHGKGHLWVAFYFCTNDGLSYPLLSNFHAHCAEILLQRSTNLSTTLDSGCQIDEGMAKPKSKNRAAQS